MFSSVCHVNTYKEKKKGKGNRNEESTRITKGKKINENTENKQRN